MARKRLPFAQLSCATCRLCFCFFGVRRLDAALPFSLLCRLQFRSLRKRGSVEARGFNPAKIRRRRAPSLLPQAALSSAWRTTAVPPALLHPAPPPRIVIPRKVQCTFRGAPFASQAVQRETCSLHAFARWVSPSARIGRCNWLAAGQ